MTECPRCREKGDLQPLPPDEHQRAVWRCSVCLMRWLHLDPSEAEIERQRAEIEALRLEREVEAYYEGLRASGGWKESYVNDPWRYWKDLLG